MSASAIANVVGRRVWDSRGRPTVEAEVHLAGGAMGRAIAPAGASKGSAEAVDLRDGGSAFGGYGVATAVGHVNGPIAKALAGLDAADQDNIDRTLIDLDGSPNRSSLGGNALVATSMATLHAAAQAAGQPLWRYLRGSGLDATTLPLPEIQIFGGGAHAGARVDIQDFMVVAPGAASFDQALEWTAEIYRVAGKLMADSGRLQGVADEGGYWPAFASNEEALETLVRAIERAGFVPGEHVAIALDIAASEFGAKGRYRLALDDRELDSDGMIDMLIGWLDRFPIVSIEDPLSEDDKMGLIRFTKAVGHRVQIVGDDFVVTNAARIKAAAGKGACNCALIRRAPFPKRRRPWPPPVPPAGAASFPPVPARPRMSPSSILPSVGAWLNSRSAPSPAPSAWQNGTRPCASRNPWVPPPVSPDGARIAPDDCTAPIDGCPQSADFPTTNDAWTARRVR